MTNLIYRKLHWTFAYNNPKSIPWAVQMLARKLDFCRTISLLGSSFLLFMDGRLTLALFVLSSRLMIEAFESEAELFSSNKCAKEDDIATLSQLVSTKLICFAMFGCLTKICRFMLPNTLPVITVLQLGTRHTLLFFIGSYSNIFITSPRSTRRFIFTTDDKSKIQNQKKHARDTRSDIKE